MKPARNRIAGAVEVCLVLATALLIGCPSAWALDSALDVSQYAHTAWKARDGFARGQIFAIAQTSDGYLWLGTEYGLFRFDGVRAVPWRAPTGQQLPSQYITALLVARDETLWIGTLKGLASWRDGQLTNYPEPAGVACCRLFQDREQKVWAGTFNPGRLCAVETGKVQCYGDGSFGTGVNGIYEDRKGNLWVAAETGVWRWKPGPPENYRLPHAAGRANGLAEDDSGTLLIGTSDGLKQLAGGKIQNYALPGVALMSGQEWLVRSMDGSVWLGSAQGLWHLHGGKAETFGVADGLSGDAVTSIFEDREGSVWVSTNGGLDRFREFAVQRISRSQGLSSNIPYSVQATQDGAIWIATSDGLNRWENGRVTVYGKRSPMGRSGTGGERQLNGSGAVPEGTNELASLLTLGLDGQGRLFVSTRDGILYFDGNHFVRVPSAPGGDIWSIAGDGHGKLWISSGTAGLFYFAPGEAVHSIPWLQLGQKGLGARALVPDLKRGGVWLGFYEGGIVYFRDGQVRASYTAANGLGKGRVNRMRFGSLEGLWAATEGGLSRLKDRHIETLNSKNGLPCDEVHWSVEDDDHSVWVYMPCGLVRIGPSEWHAWVEDPRHVVKTTVFDSSDGVPSVGVYGSNGPHVTKAPGGKIWFTSNDGVSVIDPRHLPYNRVPPPVQIEQVVADRKSYYDSASGVTGDADKRLRLPALSRDLQIDYTALSLAVPEKVRFRYKLEGRDSDWQDAGSRRQAFYSDLAPRNYRFRVMACNNSGVWNEEGAFVDFSIASAYYQTAWFRASCVVAFLALLWWVYELRRRQLEQHFAIGAEARVNERTRIARDLHDTLLQSLHGLMFRVQAARNLLPRRTEEAMEALDGAITRTEQAIAESRDTIRDLRPEGAKRGDLAALLTAEGRELEEAQKGNAHALSFETIVEGERQALAEDLQDEVCCIARELLRNAFRHAQAHRVEAEVRYGADVLRVQIRDDGKGIAPDVLKDGTRPGHWGLPGVRERAKRIGARLDFWSQAGAGTEVQLSIPAAVAYEKPRDRRGFRWFGKARVNERRF